MLQNMPAYQFRKVCPDGYVRDDSGNHVAAYAGLNWTRKHGQDFFKFVVQAHVDDLLEDPWTRGPDE